MNKKYAILSIVLIALMSLSLIPASRAFQTGPGSTPTSTRYEEFGPRPSTLIMNVYTSYAAMWAAFQTKTIDFMDGNILPTDYNTIQADPTFTTGDVLLFGLREFDMNSYYLVAPFNNTDYRKGLNSLIDRVQWMTTYFPSGGLPAYTVLQSQGSWADPLLGPPPIFPQDFLTAYADFCTATQTYIGQTGAPTADALRPGYSTWYFPNPYPTTGSNLNPTPYPGDGPAIGQNQILFYIRNEATERRDSGVYLVNEAQNVLPAFFANPANAAVIAAFFLAHPTWKYPGYGTGSPLYPELNFYNNGVQVGSSVTSKQVMAYYRFQLYTGGWTTGSTPDFMDVWRSDYAPQNNAWTANAYNFGSFIDPTFDSYVVNMETEGLVPAHGDSVLAQEELIPTMAGVIPWYIYSGKTATLTADYNAVNALGVGFGNWYSFFDAYKQSGTGSGDTMIWGWESDMHTNANPISSTWAWDWYMIAEIYDSMLALNPYDTSNFRPGLADNYSVDINPSINGGNTVISINLREDVFWQDVPFKDRSAYTVDGGHELDGPIVNIPLTVLDVAWTYQMARDFGTFAAVHINPDAADVGYVVVSSLYNSSAGWPYWNAALYPNGPAWYNSTYALANSGVAFDHNFVRFDPTLEPETIKIYLTDQMTWLAFYTDLGIPIYPMHIFQYLAEGAWMHNGVAVKDVYTMNLSPLGGADLMYGTGPYIWLSGTAGSNYNMIAYATGASYRGITEQNSYFWMPVRVQDSKTLGYDPETPETSYDPSSGKVTESYVLVNKDTINGYSFTITGTLAYKVYSGSWGPTLTLTSPITTSIGPGATKTIVFTYTLPGAPLWFVIHESFRLLITSGPFSGRSILSGDFMPFTGAKQWSDNSYWIGSLYRKFEIVPPYMGDANHDGTVGAGDLHILGVNWGLTVPPADPNADMNGDLVIGAGDLHILGVQWGITYASPFVLPPDPTSPP